MKLFSDDSCFFKEWRDWFALKGSLFFSLIDNSMQSHPDNSGQVRGQFVKDARGQCLR